MILLAIWTAASLAAATTDASNSTQRHDRADQLGGVPLVATSSGSHLWIARAHEGECRILHHAASMPDGALREASRLPRVPEAMAASGDQLWLVMPAEGKPRVHPVYSTLTRRNPATGLYFDTPLGRFDVLPSLPAGESSPRIAAADTTVLASVPGGAKSFSQLDVTQWKDVQLPLGGATDIAPVVWHREGVLLIGGASVSTDGLRWVGHTAANFGGDWIPLEFPHDAVAGFIAWVPGASTNAFLRARSGVAAELCVMQASGVRVLAEIPAQSTAWSVLGLGDAFVLAAEQAQGEVSLSRIDPVSGVVAPAAPSVAIVPQTFEWVHLPLLGAATIALLLIGFVMRPPLEASRRLPGGWSPLPMGRRVVALAFDLLPGAAISLGVTGSSVESLLAMPAWTPQFSDCAASALMVCATSVWCGVFEVTLRASPGKWLVGGRVIASTAPTVASQPDARAGTARVLGRALVKGVVLLAPALGVLAFVHPLHMGVPETISGTAVARRHAPMA